ncbi:MAG TPA: alpha-L-fucosidase [Verrucomicrobiae bacterium]|nr:alpha-L-fucosidase [Verrucomicrobiae bacterium]
MKNAKRFQNGGRYVEGHCSAFVVNTFVALILFAFVSLAFAASEAVTEKSFKAPSQDSPEMAWWRESMKTHDERIAWWREARFGMFVHWGVYSSLGNEYKGRRGGTYAEHIQRVLKIPIAEYRREVAGHFNPTNFNADEWIRTAKEAGMGYFIITSKHHDGFAMWPTKVNDYNVMDATPWHHDPMKDLRAACKKYGVKFGFYYSHAFDWGNENAPGNDWDFNNPGGDKLIGGKNWWETKPEFLASARKYVDEKSIPQLQELIRNYDPDIFWFDTPSKLPESENYRILKAVREASPRVVINGRIVRDFGDYASTADRPAEFSPHDGDWEGIPTTNESYGWNKFDDSHKPPAHFIQLLAKAVARGGNMLMNIGPMGDGRMDPKDVAILKSIGDWWKVNGESIRGCDRTPLPVQTWGESTRQGDTLYLHVFDWPKDGTLVIGGLKSNVKNIRLLSASRAIPFSVKRLNTLDVAINGMPAEAPDAADSVIAIECEGGVIADNARLLQPSFATETLRVFDAQLHGKSLRFGPGKVRDAHVTGWKKADDFISWPVRIDEPAEYEVELVYDAEPESAGATFAVNFGSQSLTGKVRSGKIQTVALGRTTFQPGNLEIKLTTIEKRGAEVMQPRSLILKRVNREPH